MKKTIKSFLICIAVLISYFTLNLNDCFAQWVQMSNGMGNITVYYLYSNGNNLYACTGNNGIYLSTNNGENWTAINNGLSSGTYVWTIQAIGNNLFAGTYTGVYRSTNNGGNWVSVNNGLSNLLVFSIFVRGTNIFSGHQTNGGICISTDNGSNWSASGLSGQSVSVIAGYGSNIYAGTGGTVPAGIFLSTDNGVNWNAVNNGLLELKINAIVSNGTYTFAGTGLPNVQGGVYRSSNNGVNWISVNNGITNYINYSFALDSNNIFVSGDSGIFYSNNYGGNWIKRNEGFVNSLPTRSILIKNGYIFAGTMQQSVWRRNLSEIITNNNNISESICEYYSLSQNYPNPFNPRTVIRFSVHSDKLTTENVQLIVYDVQGREVQILVNERLQPGTYERIFDGSNLTSGVYFYRLTSGEFTDVNKLVLLK